MPTLTINPEYAKKLRELHCYNAYVANVKAQWDNVGKHGNLSNAKSWFQFIDNSFVWSDTPERHTFWSKISDN